jgi:hypothetical protein
LNKSQGEKLRILQVFIHQFGTTYLIMGKILGEILNSTLRKQFHTEINLEIDACATITGT